MGLFGGSTTYVASTLYNLAGDELGRPNYLKTTVVGASLVPSRTSIGEGIVKSYLKGPQMKYRSFFRWAELNYAGIGVPGGSLGGTGSVDAATVASHIPHTGSQTISVQQTKMDVADFSYWVERYLFDNYPDEIGTAYHADIAEATNLVTVTFVDNSVHTFTATGFVQNDVYIYAAYTITEPAPVTDPPTDPLPPPVTTGPFMFIYHMGGGIAELDALFVASVDDGEYMPYIPIRLNNTFLSTTFNPESYELAKKATRRAGAGKLDKLIEKINDNPSLADIDYAYIFFGAVLNAEDKAARQYLYRFFDKLRTQQTSGNAEWVIYQNTIAGGGVVTAPQNVVQIKTTGSLNTNVDMKITWNSISKTTGSGEGKPGAKKGDYWLETITVTASDNTIKIWHQINATQWENLTVIGAVHDNLIYNNKSVRITAKEALADTDESGFLVPLHYATMRDMSLVDSTQMSTACSFIVFNSYKVVKQKWYQTLAFKIFIFVAIIAITVLTAGAGTAPSVGLLGSAAAVGAAIGLTGTLAIIVGAVINALVAMILMKIIALGSVALFGEKWGAIIGMVISIVTLQVGTGLMNGASMSSIWGNLMKVDSIIALTQAAGSGVSGYIAAGARETMAKTEQLTKDYKKEASELAHKFADEFGYGKAILDPLALTDNSLGNLTESEFQFLSRTLMTGTDIAEMTKDMLNNMASYTLTLDTGQR